MSGMPCRILPDNRQDNPALPDIRSSPNNYGPIGWSAIITRAHLHCAHNWIFPTKPGALAMAAANFSANENFSFVEKFHLAEIWTFEFAYWAELKYRKLYIPNLLRYNIPYRLFMGLVVGFPERMLDIFPWGTLLTTAYTELVTNCKNSKAGQIILKFTWYVYLNKRVQKS